MKIIVNVLVMLIALTSCGQVKKNEVKSSKENEIKQAAYLNGEYLDSEILDAIKDYYYRAFQIGSNEDMIVKETIEDGDVILRFFTTEDGDSLRLSTVYIPHKIVKDSGNLDWGIFVGDLNNDKLDDLIIYSHNEGLGGGGNLEGNGTFVFVNINGKFSLVSSGEDCCCDGFNIERIENGVISGKAFGYADSDARCCPSESYEVKAVLKGNKIEEIERKRIK